MEIRNKRVLVLGGAGLVGMAICRKMLDEGPDEIILASLDEDESKDAVEQIRSEDTTKAAKTILTPAWGNIFLRDALQDINRKELLENAEARQMLIEDVMGELTEEVLQKSALYQLVFRFRPHVVIDCINSATALAYQDVFTSYRSVTKQLKKARAEHVLHPDLTSEVEKLMCTLYIPQLIRHVQILYESMRRVRTEYYFKIGTSGTGGMGLNIPYTHSEEKPSRMLLSKSSVAGAHSMLLFLMARTPDAPITKEIKPTAAIAWKRIAYGPIKKGKQPIMLYNCQPEQAVALDGTLKLNDETCAKPLKDASLNSVFIDTGENGIFSRAEFEAITSFGQMEFITPEEIAKDVVYEMRGGNTGHDIINALDNATMGPTYRAGLLRERALTQMEKLIEKYNCTSVAFELLGPPRLSKLLYEGYLLKIAFKKLENVQKATEEEMVEKLENVIIKNDRLRSEIISIGIPILLSSGDKLIRGPRIKIPSDRGEAEVELTVEKINTYASEGWVDLRLKNMRLWKKRINGIFEEVNAYPEENTSSRFDRDRHYWSDEEEINTGKVAGWILLNEEKGARMKD